MSVDKNAGGSCTLQDNADAVGQEIPESGKTL